MRAEGALFTLQGPIFSDPPTPSDLRNRVRVVTRHTLGIKDDSPLHNLTGVCGVSSPPFPSARFLITWPEKLACDWLLRAAYYGTSAGGEGGASPRHVTMVRRSGSRQLAIGRFRFTRKRACPFLTRLRIRLSIG